MGKRTPKGDRELGMTRRVTRRQFLDGLAVGTAGLLGGTARGGVRPARPEPAGAHAPGASTVAGGEAADALDAYPPARTGLRGSHDGSYEVAHAISRGRDWKSYGPARDTGETYDLIVVGGGLSGLAAAYFYSRAAGGRVLVLDNHDDLGGHARRNEFTHGGRTLIGYGGSWAVDSPAPYSGVARGLLEDLGVEVSRWERVHDKDRYPALGLGRGIFFDRETFGADRLLADPNAPPLPAASRGAGAKTRQRARALAEAQAWRRFAHDAPLPAAARRDLRALYRGLPDPWPELSSAEKKARLARMSYARYLTDVLKLHPMAVRTLQARTHPLFGVGIDAVPAQDAWGLGHPGFAAMQLDAGWGRGMNRDAMPSNPAPYFFHFPDGNASIARMLVRALVPGALGGRTMDDAVTARLDYGALDRPGQRHRIRLASTVVNVRHAGERHRAKEVDVSWVRDGKLESARAKHCALACWHGVIPWICPELPEGQREALAYGVKVPLLYTSVLVRDWRAFARLGMQAIHAPGAFHSAVSLSSALDIGGYATAREPGEPMIVHLTKTPCKPGLAARDQHRAGRGELLALSFEDIERRVRDDLQRMLGGGGFDAARDVLGLTVNRWAHGYAYQYNSLWDPFWLAGEETPCERARKRFGLIAIANADAGAYAYADGAIDHAHRAVSELVGPLRRG